MGLLYFFTIAFFLVLCLILTLVVLMQESKSAGLGASFGGDSPDSLFGVSTPHILKVITGWLAAIFMISCFILSSWTTARGKWHSQKYMEKSLSEDASIKK
ncbi:MAG: preprotein translocase subunit SecG [Chlamydia sp.]